MYQDINLQFAAAQAVTTTGTLSTNVLDLGVATRDMGKGEPLNIDIRVNQAVTAAGAATVRFQLVVADTANMLTNPQIVAQTDDIPKASLPLGQVVALRWGRADPYVGRRFVAIQYTIGTGPLTAGQFTIGVVHSEQDPQTSLPSGFAVL